LNDIILTKRFGKIVLRTTIILSSFLFFYKYIKIDY
jgi:hypothetical protein